MTPLRKGARVAVVAPSGIYDPVRLETGLAIARSHGLEPHVLPGARAPWRFLASDDATRLGHLAQALTEPGWDAVWIARGGYGITRLLPHLPLDRVDQRPVIGFSDVTALLQALPAHVPRVHGPMPHSLPINDNASADALFALLSGKVVAPLEGTPWIAGSAQGPLVVGNLTMFAALCGTRWQPRWRDAIVVLEDVGEAPYRIDRVLQQLKQAGAFDGVAAVCFGDFDKCDPPSGADYTLRDILVDAVRDLGVPVLGDLGVGHGKRNQALIWGSTARLDSGRLVIL